MIDRNTGIHKAEICIYVQRKCMPYLVKKSSHFLPIHFNGDFSCWTSSSCESSWLTSMMEYLIPFSPIFFSTCFKSFGWVVGCSVQHWAMRFPFLWKWVKTFCICCSIHLFFHYFLYAIILFHHIETWWLFKPQYEQQLFLTFMHADLSCLT